MSHGLKGKTMHLYNFNTFFSSRMLQILFVILSLFILIPASTTSAQEHSGPFLKLSFGPGSGITKEYSSMDGTGHAIVTKNHGIGWAFQNGFALSATEFGGLVHKKVGEYNYINLDAPLALGLTYDTPWGIILFLSGGPGLVYYAHNWTEATGDFQGAGFGINSSVEKEWMLSDYTGIGTGLQMFYIQTKSERFNAFEEWMLFDQYRPGMGPRVYYIQARNRRYPFPEEWMLMEGYSPGMGLLAYYRETKNKRFRFLNVSINIIGTFYYNSAR